MINNRQDDLMKVFDKTWKANHNDVVRRGKEGERKFMDKMFGGNRSVNQVRPSTPEQSAQDLQRNINAAFNGQRSVNINNIIKKWK